MKGLVVAAVAIGLAGSAMARDAQPPPPPVSATQALEPSPERMALARRLVSMNGGKAGYLALVDKITTPGPGESADLTAAMAKNRGEMRQKMLAILPDLLDAAALIYAHTYTDEQLRDIVAYVESPTGQAVQAKRPKALAILGPESQWAMGAITADSDAKAPAPPPLPQPQPSVTSLALAARMVALSHAAEGEADAPFALSRMIGAVMSVTDPKGETFKPEPDDSADTRRMKARAQAMLPKLADRLAWICASLYSDDELRGQIAYLESPTGQAAQRLKAKVEAQVQAAMMGVVRKMMADAQKAG